MRRVLVALVVSALLVAPPAAIAQSDPFSPLPPPAPTQAPPPAPADDGDFELGRTGLILLGLAVIGAFAAVIWAITRDARRSLSEHDREQIDREERGMPGERKVAAKSKSRARRKAKAQRQARRRNR